MRSRAFAAGRPRARAPAHRSRCPSPRADSSIVPSSSARPAASSNASAIGRRGGEQEIVAHRAGEEVDTLGEHADDLPKNVEAVVGQRVGPRGGSRRPRDPRSAAAGAPGSTCRPRKGRRPRDGRRPGSSRSSPAEGGFVRSRVGELEPVDIERRRRGFSRHREPARTGSSTAGRASRIEKTLRARGELLRQVPGGGRKRLHRLERGHRHQTDDGQLDTVDEPCADHGDGDHEHDPHRGVGRKGHGGGAEGFDPGGPFAISGEP